MNLAGDPMSVPSSFSLLLTAPSSSSDLQGLAGNERKACTLEALNPPSKDPVQESLRTFCGVDAVSGETGPSIPVSTHGGRTPVQLSAVPAPSSPFRAFTRISRVNSYPSVNAEPKDTSFTNASPTEFKSPRAFPSDYLSYCTSAFQSVKPSSPSVECLRRKISSPLILPECASHPQIRPMELVRPVALVPTFCPVPAPVLPQSFRKAGLDSSKTAGKREAPEESEEEGKEGDEFVCKHCNKRFLTGQALGGHMSRKHSGKSTKYNYKKDVRKRREFERMKLWLAKKRFFASLNFDYEELIKTPKGKLQAKTLINRSRIKKLKSTLTDEEVYNFFESQ